MGRTCGRCSCPRSWSVGPKPPPKPIKNRPKLRFRGCHQTSGWRDPGSPGRLPECSSWFLWYLGVLQRCCDSSGSCARVSGELPCTNLSQKRSKSYQKQRFGLGVTGGGIGPRDETVSVGGEEDLPASVWGEGGATRECAVSREGARHPQRSSRGGPSVSFFFINNYRKTQNCTPISRWRGRGRHSRRSRPICRRGVAGAGEVSGLAKTLVR